MKHKLPIAGLLSIVVALFVSTNFANITHHKAKDEKELQKHIAQILKQSDIRSSLLSFDFDNVIRLKKGNHLRNGPRTHKMLENFTRKGLEMLALSKRNNGRDINSTREKKKFRTKYDKHLRHFSSKCHGKPIKFGPSPIKKQYYGHQLGLSIKTTAILKDNIVMAGGNRQSRALALLSLLTNNMLTKQKKTLIYVASDKQSVDAFAAVFTDRPYNVHVIHYPLGGNVYEKTVSSIDGLLETVRSLLKTHDPTEILLSIDFNETLYMEEGEKLREGFKTWDIIQTLRRMGVDMYVSTAKMKGKAITGDSLDGKPARKLMERLRHIHHPHTVGRKKKQTLGFQKSPFKKAYRTHSFTTAKGKRKFTALVRGGVVFAGGSKWTKSLALEHMLDKNYFKRKKTVVVAIDNKDMYLKPMAKRFATRRYEQLHVLHFPYN